MENINNFIFDLFSRSIGVNTDTRSLKEGELFFALKGDNFNGNKYAQSALESGAIAVIIDEVDYAKLDDPRYVLVDSVLKALQILAQDYRKSFNIPVIGLTGSNGKTTTKELLNAVLGEKFNVHATSGNFNNHIGVPLTILSAKKETEILLIEMGANFKGEIQELCEIASPNLGLITNISKAHLEGFGNFDTIIETKTALYRYLVENDGIIFINSEDSLLMSKLHGNENVIRYAPNDILTVSASSPNITWTYELGDDLFEIETNLVGEYNCPNIAVAITIGRYFDIPYKRIIHGLSSYIPSNNRSQLKIIGSNKYILDAYNANPTSMKLSIKNMLNVSDENKVLILGDMLELGSYEKEAHQEIVDIISTHSWKNVFLVGKIFSDTNRPNTINSFENVSQLKAYLKIVPLNHATILLKGSRGIALEKLIN